MFQLLLSVCLSAAHCEYLAPPLVYASEEACRFQAALIAGTVAGAGPPGGSLSYRFRCQGIGSSAPPADWIEVTLAAPLPAK